MSIKKFSLDLSASTDAPEADAASGGASAEGASAEGAKANAFVVVDLPDAELSTGTVRAARKILIDGARTLARSETYAWALIGERNGGAAAGINAAPEIQVRAVEAFNATFGADPDASRIGLRAGKGVSESPDPLHISLLASGVVAATTVGLDGLKGHKVTVEKFGEPSEAIASLLAERGAEVELLAATEFASSESRALICGSRSGLIDHETAARLNHQVVIPMGPTPITARALATFNKRGVTVIADFLSTCGPLFAHRATVSRPEHEPDGASLAHEVDLFVTDRCNEFESHPDGPFLGACYAAEEFLGTWQSELPFGRPLA